MAITRIDQRTTGVRTISGTDWPVIDTVERRQYGKRVEWVVTRALCNGVPASARAYRTKRAALADFYGTGEEV